MGAVRAGGLLLLLIPQIYVMLPGIAQGETYHVSPNGNGDGSAGNPMAFFSVFDRVNPGDVVLLHGGTYNQTLMLRRSGTAEAPITFRAADGELPILQGPGGAGVWSEAVVSHILLEGLIVKGWTFHGMDVGRVGATDITVRYCLADGNGVGGITLGGMSNAVVEYSISCRNGIGNGWSSNFNMFNVRGDNNMVRGCVGFQGVDNSGQGTDGNGFIADLTLDQGSVLFENNVGFLNGGACIASTDSHGSRIVGNTCWHNAQDSQFVKQELGFTDTCRGEVDGINVGNRNWTFDGILVQNNVLIPSPGKEAIVHGDGCQNYQPPPATNTTLKANHMGTGDGTDVLQNPLEGDFRPLATSAIDGKADMSGIFPQDIGFDVRCLKREDGQQYAFWRFSPDLDYIAKVGGIKGCFSPQPRGNQAPLGAYQGGAGGSSSPSAVPPDVTENSSSPPASNSTNETPATGQATSPATGIEGTKGQQSNEQGLSCTLGTATSAPSPRQLDLILLCLAALFYFRKPRNLNC